MLNSLAKYGSHDQNFDVRLEALRIIANALLASHPLRQAWDGVSAFAKQYMVSILVFDILLDVTNPSGQNPSVDEEFVIGRILFLSTIEGSRIHIPSLRQTLKDYITEVSVIILM